MVCAESGNFSWWVYFIIMFLLNVIERRKNLTNWSTHQWIRTWWEGLLAEGDANCEDGWSDKQQFMLLSGYYATQQPHNHLATNPVSGGMFLFKWLVIKWSRTQQFAVDLGFLFQCYKWKWFNGLPTSFGFDTSVIPFEALYRTQFNATIKSNC